MLFLSVRQCFFLKTQATNDLLSVAIDLGLNWAKSTVARLNRTERSPRRQSKTQWIVKKNKK